MLTVKRRRKGAGERSSASFFAALSVAYLWRWCQRDWLPLWDGLEVALHIATWATNPRTFSSTNRKPRSTEAKAHCRSILSALYQKALLIPQSSTIAVSPMTHRSYLGFRSNFLRALFLPCTFSSLFSYFYSAV
jgi:hypothetical protein